MTYLVSNIDPCTLALSIALGVATSLAWLEVRLRVGGPERMAAHLWWAGGALVVGTGLWASHFLAMHAYRLPIPVGYSGLMTFLSWVLGVGAAGFGLSYAMRPRHGAIELAASTVVLAPMLCLIHYTAVAAADFVPGIDWQILPLVLSGSISVLLSATLLWIFDRSFVAGTGFPGLAIRGATAAVIGLALHAHNAFGMAAVRLSTSATSLSALALDGTHLTGLIVVAVPLLVVSTLLGSIGYGVLDRRRSQLAGSLETVAARLHTAHDELREQAMRDPLTGLPNRLLFEDRLAQALLRAERARKSVRGLREKLAVLFIDIDGFKPVNDSFGHAAGDDVICQLAERLRREARNHDTVSRVGADQFLLLMEGATSANDCVALAARILDAMKPAMTIGERTIRISVSIGIVVYPDHGEPAKLLTQADAAMQAAKRAGRGTYALFESHMHKDIADQLDLVNDLRLAIEHGQLELHYQPKIDGRRHLICGVEALLRWHHPTRGSVSPGLFIPSAERFGLINALGNWVIDEACRQMGCWNAAGVHMRVAINLSVHQLREADLVARIQSALARHGVKASQLLCEITESVAMQDISATQRTLDELGQLGVYLAIDDFGTGYSSLSYLRQLPARQLKIDRTFINDLEVSDDAKAVVDGVVRLAHALGLRVVAEGVETARQRDILLELNCDELQGFFFARPMSADKLLAWTHGHKPTGALDFAQSLMHASA